MSFMLWLSQLWDFKKVSIIIPTYNRKDYLLKTLSALRQNNYSSDLFEVIVADDGSTDKTVEMLKQYNFPFVIKHVFQKDKGYRLSKIRNEGIKLATYDYIIFLDGDMVPNKNLIKTHVSILNKGEKYVSIGHRKFVSFKDVTLDLIQHDLDQLEFIPLIKHRKTDSCEDWRMDFYNQTNFLKNSDEPYWACCGGNLAIHKQFIIQVGMFDEEFAGWGREDNELGYRLYKNGAVFIPNLLAIGYHLDHEVNLKSVKLELKKNHRLFESKLKPNYDKNNSSLIFKNVPRFIKKEKNVSFYHAEG